MNDAETLAALERLLKTHEERCLTAGVYAKDAALIRALIETLRAGQCRALGALPGKS